MNSVQSAVRLLLLNVLALLLTATTIVLGAAPLQVIRKRFGQGFLLGTVALALGLVFVVDAKLAPAAMSFLGLSILVLTFNGLESKLGTKTASLASVLAGSSIIGIGLYLFGDSALLETTVKAQLAGVVDVDYEKVLATIRTQAVSIVVGIMIVSLVISLSLEKLISQTLMGVPSAMGSFRMQNFRVPDVAIWVLIPSLLLAHLPMELGLIQVVAANVFNVMVVLYFLAGVAIVSQFFSYSKMSLLWRTFFYIFIFTQVYLVLGVATLGLSDFWFDFRSKLKDRSRTSRES